MDQPVHSQETWLHFVFATWLGSTVSAILHSVLLAAFTILFVLPAIVSMEALVYVLAGVPHGFALASAIVAGGLLGMTVFRRERHRKDVHVKVTPLVWAVLFVYGNTLIAGSAAAGWLAAELTGSFVLAVAVALLLPPLDHWMAKTLRFSPATAVSLLLILLGLFVWSLLHDGAAGRRATAERVLKDDWDPLVTEAHFRLQRRMGFGPA